MNGERRRREDKGEESKSEIRRRRRGEKEKSERRRKGREGKGGEENNVRRSCFWFRTMEPE